MSRAQVLLNMTFRITNPLAFLCILSLFVLATSYSNLKIRAPIDQSMTPLISLIIRQIFLPHYRSLLSQRRPKDNVCWRIEAADRE